VAINLCDEQKDYVRTIAHAGLGKNKKKVLDLLGYPTTGHERPLDEFARASLQSHRLPWRRFLSSHWHRSQPGAKRFYSPKTWR
jgi:hypothetical protein